MPFLSFLVELSKSLETGGQDIKILTHMKKLHFGVKYDVFSENENEIMKILIIATHGLITIFSKCSKFHNDLINILGDMVS